MAGLALSPEPQGPGPGLCAQISALTAGPVSSGWRRSPSHLTTRTTQSPQTKIISKVLFLLVINLELGEDPGGIHGDGLSLPPKRSSVAVGLLSDTGISQGTEQPTRRLAEQCSGAGHGGSGHSDSARGPRGPAESERQETQGQHC